MEQGITVITGPSGSGKTTVLHAIAAQDPNSILIDQKPITRNPCSSLLIYLGFSAPLRRYFTAETGLGESLFSRNSAGACSQCQGLGEIKTDMAFMDTIYTICRECSGTGYSAKVRSIQVNGMTIADIEALTVQEFYKAFSGILDISATAQTLNSIGLSYLILGESLANLSGGEAVRIKIAKDLRDYAQGPKLYALDEPTTGLHPKNIDELYEFFDYIIAQGHTIIVVDHMERGSAHWDWHIQIGPVSGRKGGQIMYMGPPHMM